MTSEHPQRATLQRAVELAGSQTALAAICVCTQGNIWQILNDDRRKLPAEYVLRIEAATGVSRHDLRPDLYPLAEQVPA